MGDSVDARITASLRERRTNCFVTGLQTTKEGPTLKDGMLLKDVLEKSRSSIHEMEYADRKIATAVWEWKLDTVTGRVRARPDWKSTLFDCLAFHLLGRWDTKMA